MTSCNSTQPLKIALIGARGRLGSEIVKLALHWVSDQFHSEKKATACDADLFLDVSTPDALDHNLKVALASKKPIVIGTTGHQDLSILQEAAKTIPIFYSPNFSIGMALMQKMSVLISKSLPEIEKIFLHETHHLLKTDAPSGSALLLAKAIEKELTIQSYRVGDLIGLHEVAFQTSFEEITVTHSAKNRALFAQGAIAAALFLRQKPPGLYNMTDLINMRHS